MTYTHTIEYCFDSTIGEYGINEAELSIIIAKSNPVVRMLKQHRAEGKLPQLEPLPKGDSLQHIKATAIHIRNHFKTVVILGTGGSSLTGRALSAINTSKQKHPKLLFIDNIDPYTIERTLSELNLSETCFLSISKSGNTLETLAQTSVCINAVDKELGRDGIKKHFFFITDPINNPLRRLGQRFNIKMLSHERDIGGRYALFTNVGLLPAAIVGLDIEALCKGASDTIEAALNSSTPSEAAKGSALNIAFMQKAIPMHVVMPYTDLLKGFTEWYRQVWAESLGKNEHGTTLINALGTIDQHSQLQLYLDGPHDKLFTLIHVATNTLGPKIKDEFIDDDFDYIKGKTIGDIMDAEYSATKETLLKHNIPLRIFTLDTLDEHTLGGLIGHIMLETIITAKLLGLNPFDQPAVEEGKERARVLLGTSAAEKETAHAN